MSASLRSRRNFVHRSERRQVLPLPVGPWSRLNIDGFRVIARKEGKRVKLYSRPGNDLTYRFSLIVEALAGLRARSCISQK
jgi:hypothetical protein